MQLETVKIEHETRGWVIINKSDYDPDVHKLYGVEDDKPKRGRKPKDERTATGD